MVYALPTPPVFSVTGVGGSGASNEISIPFAFGDASPSLIGSVPLGKEVLSAQLFITTAFNGVGAALTIGTLGTPNDLMASGENDPAVIGEYSVYTKKTYGAATSMYIHITPGAGASAGAGVVVVKYQA